MTPTGFASLAAYIAGALALLPAAAEAQCAGGLISNCPPAVAPQPTDSLLLWQYGQSPHQRKIPIASLASSFTGSNCIVTWSSNQTVAAGTFPCFVPQFSGSISSIVAFTNGTSPSFSASVQIAGAAVAGCTSVSVTSSTAVPSSCTGSNAFVLGQPVNVVVTNVSGTPSLAVVQINFN